MEKKISCEWGFMTIGYKRKPYYMIILSITHSLRQSLERALAPHTRVRYSLQSPGPHNPLNVNSVSVAPVLLVDGWNCSVTSEQLRSISVVELVSDHRASSWCGGVLQSLNTDVTWCVALSRLVIDHTSVAVPYKRVACLCFVLRTQLPSYSSVCFFILSVIVRVYFLFTINSI